MKKYLIVTEKVTTNNTLKDGGYSLLETLKRSLFNFDIISFNYNNETQNEFTYPIKEQNKFLRRIQNAAFIKSKIEHIIDGYTDIIFIHVSMCFGYKYKPNSKRFLVFPMFLAPSYLKSGYKIPHSYKELEKNVLDLCDEIISPSFYEMSQIVTDYKVNRNKITVVPRGVPTIFTDAAKKRVLHPKGELIFCSLASIKPQKNTLELIEVFYLISKKQKCTLKIIGAIQDNFYYEKVLKLIKKYSLEDKITFSGYIPHSNLVHELKDVHIQLTTSNCETFGRSIFETLSLGIPNICSKENNASFDYLNNFPFVKYYDHIKQIPELLSFIINNYSKTSNLAPLAGTLFNDSFLGNYLGAIIKNKEHMIIADFDGTIYDKNDSTKTKQNIEIFNSHTIKVICSSRPISYLKQVIIDLKIKVDYVIAFSGAVITNGEFDVLHINSIEKQIPDLIPIYFKNKIVQFSSTSTINSIDFRNEIYNDKIFISKTGTTKLSSILQLLKLIDWKGTVSAYGDSKYDYEFLRYFDGQLIETNKDNDNTFKLKQQL